MYDHSALDQLIVGRVEPHIYAFTTETIPNYLKIGDTYRSVEKRLEEWKRHYEHLKERYRGEAKVDDEVYFRDYAIHEFVTEQRGRTRLTKADIDPSLYYSREFFKEATVQDIEDAIEEIKLHPERYPLYRFDALPIDPKPTYERLSYLIRPNQQKAIDRFMEARAEGRRNLLMYAVMRFGKSFTAICCAKEMQAKLVLVLSGKSDVGTEWRKAVMQPAQFSEFEFLDRDDLDRDHSIIQKKIAEERSVVVFLTLQDLQGKKLKERHKEIFTNEVDLLIVDETHFGARAEKYGEILKETNLTKKQLSDLFISDKDTVEHLSEVIKKELSAKIQLHLSGTPYRILMGSEYSKEDVIAFCQFADIIKEQEEWDLTHLNQGEEEEWNKGGENVEYNEWDNPYYGFPQMVRFAFHPNEASRKKIEEMKKQGITYTLSALLRPKSIAKDSETNNHTKFEHEAEVLELFEVIDGSKEDRNVLGFLDYDKIKEGKMCRHIVIVLPFRASCDALAALIHRHKEQFKHLNSYKVLNIAGVDVPNRANETERIKAEIARCESEGIKTITLTVNRMLTGSTVKEWDTMIYLKDTSSPQEYDQSIFRIQNPYIKRYREESGKEIQYNMKPQTLLVDFDINRMFRMQQQKTFFYNANTELMGNDHLTERLKQELAISPIVVVNKDKIEEVTPTDIIAALNAYSENKSVFDEATEIPPDLELLNNNVILRRVIEQENEIDSKSAFEKKPYEGEGSSIDPPNADGTTDTPPATNELTKAEEQESEKDPLASLKKKFAMYCSRVLFFAFLSKSDTPSLHQIIEVIDGNAENRRIAANFGLRKEILQQLQALHPTSLLWLDNRIGYFNNLFRNREELHPIERVRIAMQKFGRISEAEVTTPIEIAQEMIALIPEEEVTVTTKFLDIAAKQGEFATAILERFKEGVKGNIYSIPTSPIAYEFTRKVYEVLEIPVENILEDINIYHAIVEAHEEENRNKKIKKADRVYSKDCYKTAIIERLKEMNFNIVVGNPPYQMNNGGGVGSSSDPIYHMFIQFAEELTPQNISMIIPSRWLLGGSATLTPFRKYMLSNKKISVIRDYINANECFSNVEIKGGAMYFLRSNNEQEKCNIKTFIDKKSFESNRVLLEDSIGSYVRIDKLVPILKKIKQHTSDGFSSIVRANDPFGFDSRELGSYKRKKVIHSVKPLKNGVRFYYYNWQKKGIGYIKREQITKNSDWIDQYKVLIPKAWGIGNLTKDRLNPFVVEPNSCCTETYLVIGPFEHIDHAVNATKYIQTNFFHCIISTKKITQNTMQDVYEYVPLQDFTISSDIDWSKSIPEIDQQLYKKYNLTKEEAEFIDSIIKPME